MCGSGGEGSEGSGGYSWGGPTGGHDMGLSEYAGRGVGSNATGPDPSGMGPGGMFAGSDIEYGGVTSEPTSSESDFNARNASHTSAPTQTQTIPGGPVKTQPSVSLAQVMNLTQDEKNTVNSVLGKTVGAMFPGMFTGMVMAGLDKVGAFNQPAGNLGTYAENFSGFNAGNEPDLNKEKKVTPTPEEEPTLKEEEEEDKKIVIPQTEVPTPSLEEPILSEDLLKRQLQNKYGWFDMRTFTNSPLMTYIPKLYKAD